MDPQSSSSSSSPVSRRNYHVFLSFRGVDTRPTFISHLYRALDNKGLYTFKDSEELEAGQRRSELFDAIEGSQVAIVTFSENYARSKWCLNELHQIMERKGQGKLTVLPIFYHVSPGEVRLHGKESGEKGCYQIAMEEMEATYGRDSETVNGWRKALWEGGDLIGFPLVQGQDEANVVQDVLQRVSKTLNRVSLEVAKYPVGIGRRLGEIRPLLHLDPHEDDVRMMGLLGPGGAGKTTLSKAICNDIADRFGSWCFLPNVRETALNDGLVQLQQTLLRELLSDKSLTVSSVDAGKQLIKERLCNKRVLIILDDVDESYEMDALAGNVKWFGGGSRIILTTRNKHVLTSNRVLVYELNLLEEEEAVHLFRLHAFEEMQEKIKIDGDLINRFVEYAGKLPLALVALGAFLRGRSQCEWEGKMEELAKSPDTKINTVLKISFDGLEESYKEMFLDVACFYKGWEIDHVKKILASCGFASSLGIEILVERCLITVVYRRVEMHDLLVTMGQSIVRDEYSKGNGMLSRIWLSKDLLDILSEERSVEQRQAVEGIVVDIVKKKHYDILVKSNALKCFKRLRVLVLREPFLIHENFVLTQRPVQLPREVRWLDWTRCSASSIEFDPFSKLVGLYLWGSDTLRHIKVKKELKYLHLEECGSLETLLDLSNCRKLEELNLKMCKTLRQIKGKGLKELKTLCLIMCDSLKTLPNLSGCQNLEDLNLFQCRSLMGLDEAVGSLENLKSLHLVECDSLKTLPDLSGCRKLEELDLRICKTLQQMKGKGSEELKSVHLEECDSLKTLLDLSSCRKLQRLYLEGCESLTGLNEAIGSLENLKFLHLGKCDSFKTLPELSRCRKLEDLRLRQCRSLTGLDEAVGPLENLKYLHLEKCDSLKTLPDLSRCRKLEKLELMLCRSLTGLDEAVGFPENLVHLELGFCDELIKVPSYLRWKYLQILGFRYCSKLKKLPAIIEEHKFLEVLNLSGTAIEELPDSIRNLGALKNMDLSSCSELTTIPSSIYEMRALEVLELNGCRKLLVFPRKAAGVGTDVLGFPNLVSLHLIGCMLKDLEFLNDLTCFETLKRLDLSRSSEFTRVPASISKFKNLEELGLDSCDRLVAITELPNVTMLSVARCRQLETFPSLHTFICPSPKKFQVDLFECDSLDRSYINRSLPLEHVRRFVGEVNVVYPGKEFPGWVNFETRNCCLRYRVSFPSNVPKDDLSGLALFVTFSWKPDNVWVNGKPLMDSYCRNACGVYSLFFYVPRHLLFWRDSDITLEFPEGPWGVQRWGMRLVCKREQDDDRIKVVGITGEDGAERMRKRRRRDEWRWA